MLKRDEHPVPIAPREVEAAVDLLATEHDIGRPLSQSVALELLEDLLAGAFLFGLLVGAIVVWTNTTLGLSLIGGGLAASVALAALPSSGIADATRKYRHAVEQSQLEAIESLRRRPWRAWMALPIVLGPIAAISGTVWLVWAQLASGEIPGAAIALIAVPSAAFWLWFALDNISEYRYFSRVSRLLDRFREEADTDVGAPGLTVSQADLGVLSRAETHRIQRTVGEAAKQLPEALEESYAVSIAPEPLEYLNRLADENPAFWREIAGALSVLQEDPRPPTARPAEDVPGAVEVVAGDQSVEYLVDEQLHRVYVVSIGGARKEAAGDD